LVIHNPVLAPITVNATTTTPTLFTIRPATVATDSAKCRTVPPRPRLVLPVIAEPLREGGIVGPKLVLDLSESSLYGLTQYGLLPFLRLRPSGCRRTAVS
jgi:hypothetical protein